MSTKPESSPKDALDDTLPSSEAPASRVETDYEALDHVSPEHYTERTPLTVGGMGRILTARDRRLHRKVAIKELRADTPELRARFEREALLTARLQHPNIVTIHEAGRWPSGLPFYTMRLVPGRSFDKVIAEATTLEQRIALLPHVLAIADAVGYAHQQRVIHRDLKPSNVLVGEFGETVVIDWGLAKDLDDTSAEPGHASAPRGDAAATEIGEVLGTPVYMPPEQAEGVAADERADVYAIGAILYHLLSGSAPYTGRTTVEVLDAVKHTAPTPLRQLQPEAPSDLLTIVERAMARDRSARYANAHELAADLRHFQTGQLVGSHHYTLGQLFRRWRDRNRRTLVVAGIAAAVLVVVGVASVWSILRAERRATEERLLAQKHRASAEQLMDFMLIDLKEKLQPIGRLDLLDLVATKATSYYADRAARRNDPELVRYALALSNMGDVVMAKGDVAAALAVYRQSFELATELAARDPSNNDKQSDLAVANEKLGNALEMQGNSADALTAYRGALALREVLAKRGAARVIDQHNVSVSHDKIGDVLLEQGDAAAALAEYRASLTNSQAMLAKEPASPELQRDVELSHQNVGKVLRVQGDLPAALASFRAALAIAEQIAAKDPENVQAQRDLGILHERIGDVLRAQGDPEALTSYRRSLALSESLSKLDPSNAAKLRDLAISHSKVGDILLMRGDKEGALRSYRAMETISEDLARRDPGNAVIQRDLSVSHTRVADVLLANGERPGALAELRAARDIRVALLAKDPNNTTWQRDLSINDNKIGDVLRAQGDLAGALTAQLDSLVLAEKLAAHDPSNTELQRDVAVGHFSVGEVQDAQGDGAAAATSFRTSLAILEKLAAGDASNEQLQDDVAELRAKLASCCRLHKR